MQEVRVTIPEDQEPQVVEVALQVGIKDIAVYRVETPGAKARHAIVSAEVATPVAQAFVDAILAAPFYDPQTTRITCRTVLAIVAPTPHAPLTRPMRQPLPVVLDELWQHSHKPGHRRLCWLIRGDLKSMLRERVSSTASAGLLRASTVVFKTEF